MNFDHILLIGFGGPTQPEEIWPFLQNVTRGIPIPEERLRSVEHHYHAVGGRSPYNDYTLALFDKLRAKLTERGITLPLFLGMRNWDPFLKDTLTDIKKAGLKRGIGVILAPHRCDASYEKYIRNVEDAKTAAGAQHLDYQYLSPWHDHSGFVEAQAEKLEKVLAGEKNTPIIFSAHSIPVDMAKKCSYVEEVTASSELIAKRLGLTNWQVAWQSRSGSPRQPWLEPDVVSVIQDLKNKGEKAVVIVPVGFLCDNVEVLFDLDIEAKQEAQKIGIDYRRAPTVMDHPKFVAMFAEKIESHLAQTV